MANRLPESLTKGQQLAQLQGQKLNCFAPQHPFAKFGKKWHRDLLAPSRTSFGDRRRMFDQVYDNRSDQS